MKSDAAFQEKYDDLTLQLAMHLLKQKELEEADDIIDALCTIDPVRTIPPYENQQNSRPPFDQTLYLSPDLLDRQFGHTWKSWAVAFAKKEPLFEDGLEVILAQTDRRSRVKALNKNCRDALDYKFSYVLQRVLDRSKACDSVFVLWPQALKARV